MKEKGKLGMMLILGKKKPGMGDSESSEDMHADAAYDALRDGNRAAFKQALSDYVRACIDKEDDPDDDHDYED